MAFITTTLLTLFFGLGTYYNGVTSNFTNFDDLPSTYERTSRVVLGYRELQNEGASVNPPQVNDDKMIRYGFTPDFQENENNLEYFTLDFYLKATTGNYASVFCNVTLYNFTQTNLLFTDFTLYLNQSPNVDSLTPSQTDDFTNIYIDGNYTNIPLNLGFSSLTYDQYFWFVGFTVRLIPSTFGSSGDYDLGYSSGYNNGSKIGYDKGYDQGVDVGSQQGYTQGYSNGYTQGQTDGYNEGFDDASGSNYTFFSLFGAIADTPIMFLRQLLGFEVFGVQAISILMSMLTGCIVLYLVRKIIL